MYNNDLIWKKEVCTYCIKLFKKIQLNTKQLEDSQWLQDIIDRYQIELNDANGVGGNVIFF